MRAANVGGRHGGQGEWSFFRSFNGAFGNSANASGNIC